MRVLPFEVLLLSAAAANTIAIPAPAPEARSAGRQKLLGPFKPVDGAQGDHRVPNTKVQTGRDYQCFDQALIYPSPDEWLSFEQLWREIRGSILSHNGGDTYVEHYLQESILQVARESNVDARLILAVIMEQSHGRVADVCKKGPHRCGLFQTPYTTLKFDVAHPELSILQIVRQGVEGVQREIPGSNPTSGLIKYLPNYQNASNPSSKDIFSALAAYESDLVSSSSDPDQLGDKASHLARFVNNIANRLVGWNGRISPVCPD